MTHQTNEVGKALMEEIALTGYRKPPPWTALGVVVVATLFVIASAGLVAIGYVAAEFSQLIAGWVYD